MRHSRRRVNNFNQSGIDLPKVPIIISWNPSKHFIYKALRRAGDGKIFLSQAKSLVDDCSGFS
jgi:hypothetical protein